MNKKTWAGLGNREFNYHGLTQAYVNQILPSPNLLGWSALLW